MQMALYCHQSAYLNPQQKADLRHFMIHGFYHESTKFSCLLFVLSACLVLVMDPFGSPPGHHHHSSLFPMFASCTTNIGLGWGYRTPPLDLMALRRPISYTVIGFPFGMARIVSLAPRPTAAKSTTAGSRSAQISHLQSGKRFLHLFQSVAPLKLELCPFPKFLSSNW